MDLEKSNYPESAPNSTPTSPMLASVVNMHFATHVRTRSDVDAAPGAGRVHRRVPSVDGTVLDPIMQAPVLVSNPPTPYPSSSTSEHAGVESVGSLVAPRTAGSTSTPIEAPPPHTPQTNNQTHSHPPASLPTSPNPPNPNPPKPDSSNSNPAINPNLAHAHLADRSPLTTPNSSPTLLRASAAHSASLAQGSINPAKRGSTTSEQSTPLHSPIPSPGTSPPTAVSQFLSVTGTATGINNVTTPSNLTIVTGTGYSTGASSTTSSAAPSPMPSPKPARRPNIFVGPPGTGSATGTATPTASASGYLTLDEGILRSSRSVPVSMDSKILVPSFSQKIPSNIRYPPPPLLSPPPPSSPLLSSPLLSSPLLSSPPVVRKMLTSF